MAPPIEMLARVSVAVPLLVSVIALATLLVATNWLPNASEVGLRVTEGAIPVPVRVTV